MKYLRYAVVVLSAFFGPTSFAQTLTLHSIVNDGQKLKVTYSKDFATCLHLIDTYYEDSVNVSGQNLFCQSGIEQLITVPLEKFKGVAVGEQLKLCHGNNQSFCSDVVYVEEPLAVIHSALVNDSELFINYQSNTCSHLVGSNNNRFSDEENFCSRSETVDIVSLSKLTNITHGLSVKLCDAEIPTFCSELQEIDYPLLKLHSALSDGSSVKVTYSKNFNTCVTLHDHTSSALHDQQYFCSEGENEEVVLPIELLGAIDVGDTVELCENNILQTCSQPVILEETDLIEGFIELNTATVSPLGELTINYNKNRSDCAFLAHDNGKPIHQQDFYCDAGNNVISTETLNNLAVLNRDVKLCYRDEPTQCSSLKIINSPPHPLKFYLRCDLVEALSVELGLDFDCDNPTQELLSELAYRLDFYAQDLNTIFSKRTIRHFVFDPETDVVLTPEDPSDAQCCYGENPGAYDHEVWVDARLTDQPDYGTYGGNGGLDSSGAGVAWNLKWDAIHDRSQLEDSSPKLEQYWRQIDHIAHEIMHVWGAGISEYYSLSNVYDTTQVEPTASIDDFWDRRPDYTADPLRRNIWQQADLDSPTTYDDLIDTIAFADISTAVINGLNRFTVENTVPDLSAHSIVVSDWLSGEAVSQASVSVWSIDSFDSYSTNVLLAENTDATGEILFSWPCAPGCFSSSTNLNLIKVTSEGYRPVGRWYSIFDAQADKLIRFRNTPYSEISLVGDKDYDGVFDDADAFPYNPLESSDSDGDRMGDVYENTYGLDLLNPEDAAWDKDSDGLSNLQEFIIGTAPNSNDTDNDGALDGEDVFPLDPTESIDTDGDGIGNNADNDDDGDGVADTDDAFPLDSSESTDTDGDGIGNNADNDDDGDGVTDTDDAFPLDSSESIDTDGDSIGNNADNDDDGDGVADTDDAYPLDSTRSVFAPISEPPEDTSSGGGSTAPLPLIILLLLVITKLGQRQE